MGYLVHMTVGTTLLVHLVGMAKKAMEMTTQALACLEFMQGHRAMGEWAGGR
jgi:hypothetical protein